MLLLFVCYFRDENATVQPQVHRSRKDDDDENEDLNESNYDEVRGNQKATYFFLQVKLFNSVKTVREFTSILLI